MHNVYGFLSAELACSLMMCVALIALLSTECVTFLCVLGLTIIAILPVDMASVHGIGLYH